MAEKIAEKPGFEEMLKAGLHFGHQTKRWNPKMKRYIFGKRNGIHIIDLKKTEVLLEEALQLIADTIMRGRKVLLVGTKKQANERIQKAAEETQQPYVVNRWLGGMLTNAKTVRKSIDRMVELEKMMEEGPEVQRSKRELSRLSRELERLHSNLNGIRDMERLPGAVLVIDINREANAVKEARCLKIPVIATLDTNCDPDQVDYPIPANDDSIRAINLIMSLIEQTIKDASKKYDEAREAEKMEREKAAAAEKEASEKAAAVRKKRDENEKAARKKAIEKAKSKMLDAASKEAKKADADKQAEKTEKPEVDAKQAAGEEVKAEAPIEETETAEESEKKDSSE